MKKNDETIHVSFDLTLNEQVRGEQVLDAPICHFHYDWDEKKNMGIANLQTINGSPVNITLHPLGIAGELDFMSDMEPTTFHIATVDGKPNVTKEVVIYRVILDIRGDNRSAAIMFNEDGSSIQASKGFMEESASKQLPEVKIEGQEAPEGVKPPIAE